LAAAGLMTNNLTRTAARTMTIALIAIALTGCTEAKRIAQVAPELLQPGTRPANAYAETLTVGEVRGVSLPPQLKYDGYDFEAAGTDDQGRSLYRVRINRNGSPSLVANTRFTPLFSLDGKDAPAFVADSYFRAHPERSANTIQPGDEFTLALPPGTFLVRWQEERDERFGLPAKVREYVSERGDRLRYYLTEPFPILYESQFADDPTKGEIHFTKDLEFLLRTGRVDAQRLAQLVYRVNDPDIFEMEQMRKLVSSAQLGTEIVLQIDRSRSYLDPVLEASRFASRTEAVTDPGRTQLTRYVFQPNQGIPYMAVEDALGSRTSLAQLPAGQVFRIEYYWDGKVRVLYKTGAEDSMGKRDPYQLREDGRWPGLYKTLGAVDDPPVKWGPGEPSDLDPFGTARDPRNRNAQGTAAYDYLIAGQVVVLTFQPTRFQSDLKAEQEFREILSDARDKYREPINQAISKLEEVQAVGFDPFHRRPAAPNPTEIDADD